MSEVKKLGSSKPRAFAGFSGFWNISAFDNFSTDLPLTPPASTPSYSTTIWAALNDESVDKRVLSIKVSGEGILLNSWMECQYKLDEYLNVSTTWLDRTYLKKQTSSGWYCCLTRRVEPQSKAVDTGYWWSGYWDLDNQCAVEDYCSS